jgi:hypothetical protein
MKTLKTKCLLAALTPLMGLALQAQAHLLDPTYYQIPNLGNPTAETVFVNSVTGTTQTYLAKNDNNGSSGGVGEGGAISSSYFTITYNFTGTDALTATISWDLTGSGFLLNYVLVKDGNAGNGNKYYALYPVSADEGLSGSGTVQVNANASKNISHIAFFGTEGGVTTPDGGTTAALLGLALTGLAGLRAKFGRN